MQREERFDRLEANVHKLIVLVERTRDDVRLAADGVMQVNERLDRIQADLVRSTA
jgi:hypothetical protein